MARAASTCASTSTSASQAGVRNFRAFLDRAADLVLSFGGSLSRARRRPVPRRPAAQDVRSRANPRFSGIQGHLGPSEPHESRQALRRRPRLRPHREPAPNAARSRRGTHQARNPLRLRRRRCSLQRATERCVGVGACLNTKGGVMCPSYRATGEEQHSTRGRARLLWRCSPARCARKASAARPSTRHLTSASVAKPAKPSARWLSI